MTFRVIAVVGKQVPPPDAGFFERAWSAIARAAANANVAVVLGTERVVGDALRITALVINRDGTIAGFQDKVQLHRSKEPDDSAGSERRVFQCGPVTFGIAICHLKGCGIPRRSAGLFDRALILMFDPVFDEAGR